MLEKTVPDLSKEEGKSSTNSLLEEADYVVLVIDALMPLNRAETKFLSKCIKRGIPAVIALSKVDKLLEEEREEVIAYVTKHVGTYSPGIAVIPVGNKDPDIDSIGNLRASIEATLAETDFVCVRARQVTYTLLEVLDVIRATAQTGLKAQQKDEQERKLEVKQRQQEIDSLNLVWQDIEQKLVRKRQQVDDMLRTHLTRERETILEVLLYELGRSSDIKTWWERDLPFRLDRELRNLTSKFAKAIDKQIAADMKWLQEEVTRQFKYPLKISNEPGTSIDKVALEQQEIPLSNSNMLKIVSRVGTALAVISTGTILVPLGFGGAGIAASIIAGLTAEQLVRRNTEQERTKIRAELGKLIQRAEHVYALEVSRRLEESYDRVISDLKQHQLLWQKAQLQALIAIERKTVSNSNVNWEEVVAQTERLIAKIKASNR